MEPLPSTQSESPRPRAAAAKIALGLALIVVGAVAGDRLLAWALDLVVARSGQRYSTLYRAGRAGERHDVVVIGDSRGVDGFYGPAIRELTGLRAMNLSYNGLSTECAEALLEDYLDRHEPPRLLVLEVTNLAVDSRLLVELKVHAARSGRIAALLALRYPEVSRAVRTSALYRFNGELFLRALYYLGRDDQDWINHGQVSPAVLAAAASGPVVEPSTRPENLEALRRMVARAGRSGIDVRLVVSPYLGPYARRLETLDGWVRDLEAALGGGTRLWNDARAMESVDAFADRLHLNERGGRAYARALHDRGFFAEGAVP